MSEQPLPADLCMRRQPRQQRSQETVTRIEQATLALLQEQGFPALNTNAIATRAGVGIKSLYHLFPNKEAIICRLAMDWLAAVCAAQEAIRTQECGLQETLILLDQALDALDARFVGYGALWQAMDLIPALHEVEREHERGQIAFWSERLRHFGCCWSEPALTALVRYFYRTADLVKQSAKEQGSEGQRMWQLHQQWLAQLLAAAIAEPDPERVWQAVPTLLTDTAG
ncbi:TetR/AcrR family transcriptional regulator [Aeromonas piscicola]